MNYRPICDVWLLARPRLKNGAKYYGAYPLGFLERARALLGVTIDEPVLHVCAGMVRQYPYGGLGPNDRTLDLDPRTSPDYCQDAREAYPTHGGGWAAVLIDPPYTEYDAQRYLVGIANFPRPSLLLRNGLSAVRMGGRVGMLHHVVPRPPKAVASKLVAIVGVIVGYDNRARVYSVFERRA